MAPFGIPSTSKRDECNNLIAWYLKGGDCNTIQLVGNNGMLECNSMKKMEMFIVFKNIRKCVHFCNSALTLVTKTDYNLLNITIFEVLMVLPTNMAPCILVNNI
jgi:hypothetical protein